MIALPERSDKKDAIALAASFTGIKFDWIDGVNGELIPEKAMPRVSSMYLMYNSRWLLTILVGLAKRRHGADSRLLERPYECRSQVRPLMRRH